MKFKFGMRPSQNTPQPLFDAMFDIYQWIDVCFFGHAPFERPAPTETVPRVLFTTTADGFFADEMGNIAQMGEAGAASRAYIATAAYKAPPTRPISERF